jgi:hypothetical protein
VPGARDSGEFFRRSFGGAFFRPVVTAYSGGLEGLGVRLAKPSSRPAVPAGKVELPSTTPLIFGDLGGDCRRDRGVGVAGGEEEPDLTPCVRRYLQVVQMPS